MSIKILLADDHKIMRDGLKALLEKHPLYRVVGEAEDGLATLKLVQELKPEVVIMDITMTNLNGIEATRRIISEHSGTRVIALSMHSDRRFVIEMLKAGASGYLLKDSAFGELIQALDAVCTNKKFLSPSLVDTVIRDYVNKTPPAHSLAYSQLTARERQVLQLIAEGNTTKEISFSLHVSVKTVETHRKRIMEKLGIYSVAGLTKFAIREGLTSVET